MEKPPKMFMPEQHSRTENDWKEVLEINYSEAKECISRFPYFQPGLLIFPFS